MPLRSKAALSRAHWSKDFVEHLRTVHFTLVVTAASLVIVATTTKPYSTAVAAKQVRQIQDLRTKWSADFVRDNLRLGTYHLIPSGEPVFDIPPDIKTLYFRSDKEKLVYEAVLPKLQCDDHRLFFDVLTSPPETVRRFGAWWNQWGRPCTVYFPETILKKGIIAKEHSSTSTNLLSPSELAGTAGIVREKVNLSLSFKDDLHKLNLQYVGELKGSNNGRQIVIPVVSYEVSDVSFFSLSIYMGLRKATFGVTFKDLEAVAKANGIESLAVLEETLSKDELSDSPVFEAFGIKFPADVATIGGTLVLLGVQLYFFIYLRRLSGNLHQGDEGWSVPWVGMDNSRVAAASCWTTIVLFPVLSLVVLWGTTAVQVTAKDYWVSLPNEKIHVAPISEFHSTVLAKLAAMTIPIIFSAYLGMQCWKYRPQVTPGEPGLGPKEALLDNTSSDQPRQGPVEVQEVDQN